MKLKKFNCCICGKEEDPANWVKDCGKEEDPANWVKDCGKELTKHQMCFTCNHWRSQHEADLNERGEHNYAIVNGEHYVLCPPTKSYFKGFGGKRFRFKFSDGTIKECNNVWFQGNIKEVHPHWLEVMPDNAVIIQ